MSTTYYLADERYMTTEEIERAKHFDGDASLCHRHTGGLNDNGEQIHIFTSYIPLTLLRNLPRDVKITGPNAPERTLGELVDRMNADGNIIITPEEGRAEAEAELARMRELRKGNPKWSAALNSTSFNPGAIQY